MIITEILCKQSGIAERVSDKTEEIIILEKFVDKIRFNYSNSFPEKNAPFVSKRKKSSFPEKPPIRFQEKRLHEKRLICFLEPRARIYSTETRQ